MNEKLNPTRSLILRWINERWTRAFWMDFFRIIIIKKKKKKGFYINRTGLRKQEEKKNI